MLVKKLQNVVGKSANSRNLPSPSTQGTNNLQFVNETPDQPSTIHQQPINTTFYHPSIGPSTTHQVNKRKNFSQKIKPGKKKPHWLVFLQLFGPIYFMEIEFFLNF